MAIEAMQLFMNFYISITCTQILPLVIRTTQSYSAGWIFGFLFPVLCNFLMLQQILSKCVLLRAVYELDADVAGAMMLFIPFNTPHHLTCSPHTINISLNKSNHYILSIQPVPPSRFPSHTPHLLSCPPPPPPHPHPHPPITCVLQVLCVKTLNKNVLLSIHSINTPYHTLTTPCPPPPSPSPTYHLPPSIIIFSPVSYRCCV